VSLAQGPIIREKNEEILVEEEEIRQEYLNLL